MRETCGSNLSERSGLESPSLRLALRRASNDARERNVTQLFCLLRACCVVNHSAVNDRPSGVLRGSAEAAPGKQLLSGQPVGIV